MKLTYLNAYGRAEISRNILAQAGADYEDIRIEKADWEKLKSCRELKYISFISRA